MKSKTLRIEQDNADTAEIDVSLNSELSKLESEGHKIKDIRIAVGRDADASAGLQKNYSVTVVILYE